MTRKNDALPASLTELHLATHLFNPPRLTLARELRGLTKSELAEHIGKSPAAIGQFESGTGCRPDARTLASIALALGVPAGFFSRKTGGQTLAVDNCHFRSLRSASQRARRMLLARASLLCDLISTLSEHVAFPAEQVSRVARSVQNESHIEAAAEHVRKAWGLGLGPIGHLVNLLERSGIVVASIPSRCSEVDAFSTWHEGRPLIFLVASKYSATRTRFDAAHELGHLVMHADIEPGNPAAEREANRFASAFLLPRESFIVECPRRLDWDLFYELKRRWKVSLAALVRRAFDLHCISEASYRRAYMQLNQSGERYAERDEPAMERPSVIAQAVNVADPDLRFLSSQLGLSTQDLLDIITTPSETVE